MAKTSSYMLELGTKAPDFLLPDSNGKLVSLDDYSDSKALLVIFMCNHCPYVIHIRQGLVRLIKQFQERGVAVVAINSNDYESHREDSPDRMAEFVERYKFTFPYLLDETQEVAKAYKATCTPDFFLFNGNRELVYRGQMDSSRPGKTEPVSGIDLKNAVDALLAGEPVSPDQRPSMGCNIKWRPGNEPNYYG